MEKTFSVTTRDSEVSFSEISYTKEVHDAYRNAWMWDIVLRVFGLCFAVWLIVGSFFLLSTKVTKSLFALSVLWCIFALLRVWWEKNVALETFEQEVRKDMYLETLFLSYGWFYITPKSIVFTNEKPTIFCCRRENWHFPKIR